jgi:hypothetical protein
MSGRRRRMRRAMGWVNSGLSMITTAFGSAAIAERAVPEMRFSSRGRRDRMAPRPITATSSSGNCDTSPCPAIAGPPTPR